MSILKQPKTDPSLAPFHDGVAELKHEGKVVGHIATSVSKFWSPFSPLSLNWWVWSVIVWADGTKEQKLEDYAPWSYVNEMKNGKLEWHGTIYSIEWLPPSKASAKREELGVHSEDF